MQGSEKISVYVATFIFTIVGYLLALIISDFLAEIIVDLIVDFNLEFLTLTRTISLLLAISFFILTFVTGWGSTLWIDKGEKIGMISLMFFILWLIASIGIVSASIIDTLLNDSSVTIDLDLILDFLFDGFVLALAPAVSVLLSISNKK